MGDGQATKLYDGSDPEPVSRHQPRGLRMAAVLSGSWRRAPPPLEISAEALDEITLGLLRSKTGALAWWRVRHSSLRTSPAGMRLREAYHQHGFQSAQHARNLVRIVTRLREGGVDPLLVKGPAIARLYPERGLRPFGDFDFCVRPDQYAAARAILAGWVGEFSPVDLHSGFARFYAPSWDHVYGRSQIATFSATDVRVLAPEDELRFLCLHQLRHGALTPLWLCDVAVALESRPDRFDWNVVLGADRRRADWVACTIGLAHRLLGSAVDDTPVADRARCLPRWLMSSVLEGWGRQCPETYQAPELYPDIRGLLARAPQTVRQYWPNPVAATIHLRRPFSDFPRLPIQVVDAFARLVRFSVRRLLGRRPDFDQQ
jgi:hypothetical protein